MEGQAFAASWPGRPGPPQAWWPRRYHQLLRGPTYRWWRPWASCAVMLACLVAVLVVVGLVQDGWGAGRGGAGTSAAADADLGAWMISPIGLASTNLMLASLVPAAQLSVWAGFGWRPRWTASIAGHVRWGWLGRCYLVSVAVVSLVSVVAVVSAGGMPISPQPHAVALAAVVLATTPLQAAGEEYLFRGWLTQAVGSVFSSARLGGVLAAVVSATLFAAAHGQQDVWLFVDRFGFGLLMSWLVWRTGGLEASIAVHGANNLLAFALTLISGQLSQMVEQTSGTPTSALVDLGMLTLTAGIIGRLAGRRGVDPLFRPPLRAW